jgi:site-specific recombinase XerC
VPVTGSASKPPETHRFAPATVAKRLSAVRSFYGYVVDRGTIDPSPAVGVKVPRTPREPPGTRSPKTRSQS